MEDYLLILTFHHYYLTGNYCYSFHLSVGKQVMGKISRLDIYSDAFELKSGWKFCMLFTRL